VWLITSAAFAALGVSTIYFLPEFLLSHEPSIAGQLTPIDLFKLKHEISRSIAQILAGVFALLGFYLAGRRILSLERQTDVQIQGQLTDRFAKAVEHLGATNSDGTVVMESFFGGVAALERIAIDSERDRQFVLRHLAAYLRRNPLYRDATRRPEVDAVLETIRVLCARQQDRQRRRLAFPNWLTKTSTWLRLAPEPRQQREESAPQRRELDFSGALLPDSTWDGCDLRNARFSRADLRNSSFRGCTLTGAAFDEVNLTEIDFTGAVGSPSLEAKACITIRAAENPQPVMEEENDHV